VDNYYKTVDNWQKLGKTEQKEMLSLSFLDAIHVDNLCGFIPSLLSSKL